MRVSYVCLLCAVVCVVVCLCVVVLCLFVWSAVCFFCDVSVHVLFCYVLGVLFYYAVIVWCHMSVFVYLFLLCAHVIVVVFVRCCC